MKHRFLIRTQAGHPSLFIAGDPPRLTTSPYPITEERLRELITSINNPVIPEALDHAGRRRLPQNLYRIAGLRGHTENGSVSFTLKHCIADFDTLSFELIEAWDYVVRPFPYGRVQITPHQGWNLRAVG